MKVLKKRKKIVSDKKFARIFLGAIDLDRRVTDLHSEGVLEELFKNRSGVVPGH